MGRLKTWLFIAFIAIMSLSIMSCRTRQEAAQRHLQKAIDKDPDIIKKVITDTIIKGVAKGKDTVYIKGSSTDIEINVDSLKAALASAKARPNKEGLNSAVIYSDSAQSVEVFQRDNKLYARFSNPPDTIYRDVAVPYEVEVEVPGQMITKYQSRPAYHYYWFWILISIISVALYLLINRLFFKKDIVKTIFIKDEKNGRNDLPK